MKKLFDKFMGFMKNRYGVDEMGQHLFVIALLIVLIGELFHLRFFLLLGLIPISYAIFRITSFNIVLRSTENRKFLLKSKIFKNTIRAIYKNLIDKIYHYAVCKQCGQLVRVPKGKGKIEITCPKCHYRFKSKS